MTLSILLSVVLFGASAFVVGYSCGFDACVRARIERRRARWP